MKASILYSTPEGGQISFKSFKALASFISRRQQVTWTRSVRTADERLVDPEAHGHAATLLAFAQSANMFPDRNGNCSWRGSHPNTLTVTPRQVIKATCSANDLVSVKHDPVHRRLFYAGPLKASIDASVQATLYASLPAIHGLLHVHPQAGLFLADAVTSFPFPCGVQEEAAIVLEALQTQDKKAPFIVELIHHGYLIGLEAGGAERLSAEWQVATSVYLSHLERIGMERVAPMLRLQPIMADAHIVGVLATHRTEKWCACYVLRTKRGLRYGRRILDQLAKKGLHVKAHVKCEVIEFYRSHGWTIVAEDEETATFAPPQKGQ